VEDAYGVVLSGREDDDIAEYFMDTAFPPTADMQRMLDALTAVDSMTLRGLETTVNLRQGRIAQALKLLELDGAVARDAGRFRRTPNPWQQDEGRIERVLAARRDELAQMQTYMQHEGCLMEFLVTRLDDPTSGPCGRCASCTGVGMPRAVDEELVRAGVSFLRRDLRPIKPRLQWPGDAVVGLTGRINPPNQPGMALCVYGDAGWGREVQRGKYVDGEFSRDLVLASARAIRDRWRMTPPPAWVTALPSSHRAGLVDRFARALAGELGLPYVDALTVLQGAPPQKTMQNSAQQLANAHRKLGVDGAAVRGEPVLLVDEIVDSGWTLTVVGHLLRTHGSGEVYPFALAVASGRDD
jgi:ATP-dependent DNA helicase RecQ